MALTAKQQRFVDEYLVDLNATQAAIRAGYSKRTAKSVGSENLTKPDIAEAVAEGQKKLAEKTEITKEMIVAELAKIAFLDVRKAVRWGKSPIDTKAKLCDPNGLGIFPVELVPSEEMDEATAAAVAEVSLTQTGVKIKFHDKKAALVDLAKMHGYMIEKHQHSVDDPLAQLLRDVSGSAYRPTASN